MNTLDKIKDKAQRIARLGAYLSSPYGPTAKRKKGLLHMTRDLMSPVVLMCELSSGRVWERETGTDTEHGELPEAHALQRLAVFDHQLTEAVEKQVRREVLEDLVQKRIRRITRTKSRGFKADLKRLKGKKQAV